MPLRRAFSLIEVTIVIAILAIVAGFSMPMYRNYQILSDLNLTADSFVQALNRAQLLSQAGEGDSTWGFHPASGVMFQGSDYASRYTLYDEVYAFPDTITVTGISEVTFSKIEGDPSVTGDIVLTALNGEQRTITIEAGKDIPIDVAGGELAICHYPPGSCDDDDEGGDGDDDDDCEGKTLKIPESAWPAHQEHGDTIGPCLDDDDD